MRSTTRQTRQNRRSAILCFGIRGDFKNQKIPENRGDLTNVARTRGITGAILEALGEVQLTCSGLALKLKLMEKKKAKFAFIDLFAGIGGFRIALESFGGECVFSSEWDKPAQTTYETNFGEVPAGDITKIRSNKILPHNVLCAGFPCQAFSVSGKQKGFKDTRGTLFFDVVRIAKYHKPEILFLENVKNFAKHDNGRTLAVVLSALDKVGYNVFHKTLNASHYGVPQSRERIYIIGFRKDLEIKDFQFPKPTYQPVKIKDLLQPNDEAKERIIKRDDIKFYENQSQKLKKNIFGNYPLSPIQIGTINKGGQGERIYSVEGHAITLSAHGGGIASKTGAYFVDGAVRKLTPREAARAMGFPEWFKIPVSDSQAYKQFGNSVVIPVLKEIFKEIMGRLGAYPQNRAKPKANIEGSKLFQTIRQRAIVS